MELLKNLVQECFYLSLLVCMVRLVVGESAMNRYLQFVVGICFLLIIFGPLTMKFSGAKVTQMLRVGEVKRAFYEQKSFEEVMRQFGTTPRSEACDLLVEGFREAISEKPYEIRQYEVCYRKDEVEEISLYLADKGEALKSQRKEEEKEALECKRILTKLFHPDFILRVWK